LRHTPNNKNTAKHGKHKHTEKQMLQTKQAQQIHSYYCKQANTYIIMKTVC